MCSVVQCGEGGGCSLDIQFIIEFDQTYDGSLSTETSPLLLLCNIPVPPGHVSSQKPH